MRNVIPAKATPARVRRAAQDIGAQLAAWRKSQDLTARRRARLPHIAEVLPEHRTQVTADRYRRVVLGVAVHSTDDHLRNHGFLRALGGWRLSPVFDVNPEPDPGRGRVTSIAGAVGPDEEPDGLLALAAEVPPRRG